MEKRNISMLRFLGLMIAVCMLVGSARGQSTGTVAFTENLSNARVSQGSNPPITLELDQVPLKEALKRIAGQAKAGLYYNAALLPEKTVSLHLKAVPLGTALRKVLEGTMLQVVTSGRNITLRPKSITRQMQPPPARAQETITGTVTDGSTGNTLPGVNIKVKGTTTGTSTGPNGQYQLAVESLQDTLVFSFVGYKTRQEPINGRTEIDVEMQTQAISGEEMVVVGYGTQRRSEVTESISTVGSEELDQDRVTRVDQALQGKVSGVKIKQTNGRPGSGMKVRIRGSKSIQGNNSPLYVVDGLIVSSISNLDPSNISSIEVLKDASATAIYGSRGSNGVILISTKRGSGKGRFTLNSSYGIQSIRNKLEIMNGPEFAKTVNAEREANGVGDAYSEEQIAELEQTGGANWQDEIFRRAPIQNHLLTYSGGNNDVDYYFSGSYLSQNGIVISQNYKRYNVRSNLDYHYSKKLDLSLNFHATRENRSGTAANVTSGIVFDPTTFNKNAEGEYNLRSTVGSNALNQVPVAKESPLDNLDHTLYSNLKVDYDFLKNFTVQLRAGIEYFTYSHQAYTPIFLDNQGTATSNNLNRIRLQNTNRLTYQKGFGGSHNIKADLIFEQQFLRTDQSNNEAWNFPSNITSYKNMAIAQNTDVSSSFATENLRSYVGRVNYSFRNKYLITGTVRIDGSSKFRKGNQYGLFPSVAFGWRLSNEPFIEKLDFFQELKLRGSYGVTGNQGVAPYATRAKLVTGASQGYPINNEGLATGIDASINLPNPDLTWEKTTQINLGLDMDLKMLGMELTIDAYKAITNKLLFDVLLPNYTGVNTITRNIGEIKNKGIEFSLEMNPVQANDFNFSTNFNLSLNRNKVVDLGEGRTRIYPDNIIQGSYTNQTELAVVQVGHPLGAFQGYTFQGIYQQEEAEEASRYNKRPGDSKYKDFNNDGVIDENDFGIIGNAEPDFIFGITPTLNYKNFDLSALIQGSYGGEIYNIYKGALYGWGAGTTRNPLHKDVLNRWTPENQSNSVAAFGPTRHGFINSTQFLEDGSYAKVKNLTVGYTFPKTVRNNLGIANLRIYLNAENLLTITKYDGFDPELSSGGASDTDSSVDYAPYPTAKVFTFGVNLTF